MDALMDFFKEVLPLLIKKTLDRTDKDLPQFSVKAYWAGSILRIDIQVKG